MRVIPQRGKVTEDHGKTSSHKQWAVFHEDVPRQNFTDNAGHVAPHAAALSVDALTPPRGADVLARKSARYDVNNSAPRSSVKGLYVIPNRESREKAVILSGAQYACWVGFPLDGTDGSPSEQVSAKYSATSACEKSQLIHAASGSCVTFRAAHSSGLSPKSKCLITSASAVW